LQGQVAPTSVWGATESATERGTRYKVQGTRYSAVQVYRIFKRLTLNVDSHIKAERKQKKE